MYQITDAAVAVLVVLLLLLPLQYSCMEETFYLSMDDGSRLLYVWGDSMVSTS
jgi:hypothetical protein